MEGPSCRPLIMGMSSQIHWDPKEPTRGVESSVDRRVRPSGNIGNGGGFLYLLATADEACENRSLFVIWNAVFI